MSELDLARRPLLKSAAWAVPAVTVAAAAPSLAASTSSRQVTGTLTWGVKQSFRNYIVNVAPGVFGGEITLSDGVSQVGGANDGVFIWPGGEGTVADDGTVVVQYAGTVNFYKHDGALDVTSPTRSSPSSRAGPAR